MARADPGFLRYLLRLTPEIFRVFQGTVRNVLFWTVTVGGTVLLAFNKRWAGLVRLEGFSPWIAVLLLGVALVFAVLRASYRMYAKEHGEVERLRGTSRGIGNSNGLTQKLLVYAGSAIEEMAYIALPEPERFAIQLRDALIAGRWTVLNFRGFGTSRVPRGIEIRCRDAANPPARAVYLKNALEEDRQVVVLESDLNCQPEAVHLKIGHAPEHA